MPQVPASPQLLLLAEPLAREGLSGLLGNAGYRLASRLEDLEGAPALVVWDVAATLPAPTLLRELEQLRGRWPGSGLLLLLAADAPYPSTWLLQLPVEGLLQQGEPEELTRAVATLLAGGRVVELRPLAGPRAAADAEPLPGAVGLGQWLLQSGLAQIEAERRRCHQWLELADRGGLARLLLRGRLRELAVARRLLLWLWGPIAMAWPETLPDPAPAAPLPLPPTASSTAITLRQRTAEGVWQAIQERLVAASSGELTNASGQLLALEGLSPAHRRDLLLALISQLDLLVLRLRQEQLRGEELQERWLQLQPDLRRLALRAMAGEYVQLPQEGSLLPVADTLTASADLQLSDPELPAPLPMLAALVLAQPLLVDGRLLAPDEPLALLQLEALIANWLIRSAELISAELLACCSTWPELRRYLLCADLLATRNLERLRNQLNSQQRWSGLFERPVQLYESQRQLYRLEGGTIVTVQLTEPRDAELRQLGWLQQLVTLALEARDALAPQVHGALRRLGDLVVVVLTQVIGRAIGLIGRGIAQGMGRSFGRS